MTHQYRQRILVTLRANGEPGGILWRGAAYSVAEVLARWHLRDRWWEARDGQADAVDGQHRGTAGAFCERPTAHGPGGRKSVDALQRSSMGSEAISHQPPRVSPDFSPSASCAGGRPPDAPTVPRVPRSSHTPSDRYYYRLRCVEGLLCEVYWDAACDAWTLDRVLD